MSIDKKHLATILELFTTKEMFNPIDKKYSAKNAARLCQPFCDSKANRKQKNVSVMEKYESMLNFNAEIYIQNLKLAFQDKYMINFILANILSNYEGIIDNHNLCNTLTLDGAVRVFHTKKTELTN